MPLATSLCHIDSQCLHAVAEAALEGRLDGAVLRADPEAAVGAVQEVKGLGPFAAELVVVLDLHSSPPVD
ncbi:MAG: hypothetical protein M3424_07045 [Actinomycetota bacterium]|nr:hypothetical protein [Actinomycetota bacterium]